MGKSSEGEVVSFLQKGDLRKKRVRDENIIKARDRRGRGLELNY